MPRYTQRHGCVIKDPKKGRLSLITQVMSLNANYFATLCTTLLLGSACLFADDNAPDYLRGATVFLDINYNGTLELNEPSAITGLTGNYIDDLAGSDDRCIGFAPIVIDAPRGALDANNNPIDRALRLTIPPAAQQRHVDSTVPKTQLSELIAQAMAVPGESSTTVSSCEQAKTLKQQNTRDHALIEDAITDAIRHYNISEAQMLSWLQDAKSGGELARGKQLLNSLIKSVEETRALQLQHTNAIWARVAYHQFDSRDADDRFPEAWYRELNLNNNGQQTFHLQRVSDDLNSVLHTIIFGQVSQTMRNGLSVRESVEVESRQGNFNRYTCDIKEIISARQAGVEYELVNLAGGDVNSFEGCSLNRPFDGRYIFVNYQQDNADFASQFYFSGNDAFAFLPDWQRIQQQDVDLSLSTLVATVNELPYAFDANTPSQAQWWVKTKEYRDGNSTVVLRRDSQQQWAKTTTKADGTQTEQCSSDGKNWRPC